jgi:hypothetical protein
MVVGGLGGSVFGGAASPFALTAKVETFRQSRFLRRGECWIWWCGFTVRLHV